MAKFIVDPRQDRHFDIYDEILSETAKRRLQSSWHFLFRQTLLQLMPTGELGEHFDPEIGRPTKGLYSMASLLLSRSSKISTANKPPTPTCSTSRFSTP